MGQYYKALVKTDNEYKVFSPFDEELPYISGYKLMEHSWIGNCFVNEIVEYIKDKPAEVIWVGDYSDGMDEEAFTLAWKYDTETRSDNPITKEIPDYRSGYLVNYDTYEYVDLTRYIKKNSDKDDWCIHPLPLLTALGNGLGGGDYYGVAEEYVGSWAGDKISYETCEPKECEDITDNIPFQEWRR